MDEQERCGGSSSAWVGVPPLGGVGRNPPKGGTPTPNASDKTMEFRTAQAKAVDESNARPWSRAPAGRYAQAAGRDRARQYIRACAHHYAATAQGGSIADGYTSPRRVRPCPTTQ